MARNRMIKPEFWSSETLSRLSLESNLLFIGMWNYADDSGVMLNNNRKLLGDIFPLRENITDKHIEKWKEELIQAGLIIPIDVNNKKLLIIKSWFEHQKVANPSKRLHIDDADEETINRLISSSLDSNESLITEKVSKEKEERGKKKEKSVAPFPDNLNNEKFINAWNKWQQHRIEIKKRLTPTSVKQQLKKLSEYGSSIAIKMIMQSIENGWTGLFELKEDNKSKMDTTIWT